MPAASVVGQTGGVLRRTWTLVRPHAAGEGRTLAAGALLAAAVVVLQVAQPWPLKWLLDYLSAGGAAPPWTGGGAHESILLLCLLFLVIGVVAAWAEYGEILLLNGLGNRVMYRFRAALFVHVLQQPLAFHESRDVGELLTRIIYDTSRLRRGINGTLIRIFQTLFLFAAIIVVLLWLDPALGSVFAGGAVLALLTMRRRGGRVAHAARRRRKKEGAVAALVANELMAVRELQAFGAAESAARQRFAKRNDRSLRQEQTVRRLAVGMRLRVDVLLAGAIAVALWLGAGAVLSGRLTPGDLVVFFAYAVALRSPLARFANQAARLGRTAACAERLVKLAQRRPTFADPPHAVVAPTLRGEIALADVGVKAPKRGRGSRKWVVHGLTCHLPAGQRTAVVGPNGAGKSTLLRLVIRLTEPSRGSVSLDGRDIGDWTEDSLRRQLSIVFQDSVLAGLTVRDIVALGMPDTDDVAIHAAARVARAETIIDRLPKGLDSPVRAQGALLSRGERQRLAVARAVLRNGRIWLLDEPTGGVDETTARDLTALLLDLTRGRTTLWVTHDPALLPALDYVLALDQGRVAFAGAPDAYAEWSASRAQGSPVMSHAES